MLTKKERIYKLYKRVFHFITSRKQRADSVFIFGEMRSGTNMLIQSLNNHMKIECYYENDEEAFENYELKNKDIIKKLIAKSYARIVAFKPIADSQNATGILKFHENSKAIWIYRRYPDVINSALKNWAGHSNYLHYMLHEPEIARWRIENVSKESMDLVKKFYEKDVSNASVRGLIWYLRNSLFFQQNLNTNPNVLLVSYEKVVHNPTEEFKRIMDFIGEEFDERIVKDIFNTSITKKAPPELDKEILKLCDDLFEKLENNLNR